MKIFYTFLFIVTLSFQCFAQTTEAKDKESIEKLINDTFNDIWSDLSTEAISKHHTEDFLLLEHGELWNNDTIARYLEQYKGRKIPRERENKIEMIEIKVFGDRAWTAYHNRAVFTEQGKVVRKAYWLESATAIRTEEGWKLDMLHSTRVKNEAN